MARVMASHAGRRSHKTALFARAPVCRREGDRAPRRRRSSTGCDVTIRRSRCAGSSPDGGPVSLMPDGRCLMRRIVLMLMSAIVGAAACSDSNAPEPARVTRRIYNIHVPATAAITDSIPVSFNYEPGACDSVVWLTIRRIREIVVQPAELQSRGLDGWLLALEFQRRGINNCCPRALPACRRRSAASRGADRRRRFRTRG